MTEVGMTIPALSRRDLLLAAPAALSAAIAPIEIDRGRQLFFDDLLVAETNLTRQWHTPAIHPAGPVLQPETPLEMNNGVRNVACPFSDGVWYDPHERRFRIWYNAGYDGIALATSEDGIHWKRPALDVVKGTNRVLAAREGYTRDGVTVWQDLAAEPDQRYKMFGYYRRAGDTAVGEVYTSSDGVHWKGPRLTSPLSDNTCFYHDPFRKLWVWSIRPNESRRARVRREHPDFLQSIAWGPEEVLGPVMRPDAMDKPDPAIGDPAQLYHFTAIAYESVMLGQFMIHFGPHNSVCAKGGFPKTTDMNIGFSRDGVNWTRSTQRPFVGSSRRPGAWNRGYVHNTGGVCLIVKDKLHFYFGAFSGISPANPAGNMYAGGSTGLAVLRRDGFVSFGDTGWLTTPPVRFTGRHLFVNADAHGGELTAEVIDQPGFAHAECVGVTSDSSRAPVRWKSRADLSSLAGKPVRLRFHLRDARLYSFWISPDRSGASYGYVAAGGPGFTGPMDTTGA
jgi:hypothetical protein